jgi:TonB-linked SusC/RagA family outer membrane protein
MVIVIGNKDYFEVTLEIDVSVLYEVVATGYQVIAKERSTGSFGQVKSEVLENETSTDLRSELEGRVTGMLVDKDRNGNTMIQIRGQSTLTAGSEPLIVVDGLPIEGGWESIESNDIESVNVLKDASAAAIWGTRAANGVIVITTKSKTRKDKSNAIDVNIFTTIGDMYDLSDLQLASSSNLVDFEYQAYLTDIINVNSLVQEHHGVSPVYQLFRDKPANITEKLNELRAKDHSKQFEEYFMQKSVLHQANITFQNNIERNSFFVSLNTTLNKGNMVGDSNQRINLNLKDHFQISEKVSFDLGLNSILRKAKMNSVGAGSFAARKPYELITGENGEYLPETMQHHQAWLDEQDFESKGYLNWDYNRLRELENKDYTSETFENRLTTTLNYNPISGLDLSTSFLYEIRKSEYRNHENLNMFNTRNVINKYTLYDEATETIDRQFPLGAILRINRSPISTYTWRNIAKYNRNFKGGDHRLNAMLGTEIRDATFQSSRNVTVGYDDRTLIAKQLTLTGAVEDFEGNSRGFGNSYLDEFGYRQERHLSYFSNFSYTLFDKYSFTASARVDKTNLFGVNKRFRNNPLWSVGGKWNIVKEEFLPDFINKLDLRSSFGYTANINRTARSYATALFGTNYLGEEYLNMRSPKNNDLGFERTAVINVGIDYSVLQNKFYGSIEFFNKKSTDVLGNVANDPTTGWSSIFSNYAHISNSGFELDVNSKIIDNKDIKWTVGFNFSTIKNSVDKVDTPLNAAKLFVNGGTGAARVGMPISLMYNWRSAGVNSVGEYLTYRADGTTVEGNDAYSLLFEDLVYSGQTDPKYFGGFTSTVEYKRFMLTANFTYKGGHISRMPMPSYGVAVGGSNTHRSIADSWSKAGDENKPGVLPAANGNEVLWTQWHVPAFRTDNRVFDASSLRFRNVVLSYNTTFGGGKKYRAQIFGEVKNVALFTKNKLGIDPDYINPYSGQLRFTEPRSFTVGIKTSF